MWFLSSAYSGSAATGAAARGGARGAWIARAAESDGQNLFDAPGARRHHGDAVAEHERLVDRMRDEDHRLPLAFVETEQLLLQHLARLRIDGGERLVHE